MPIYEYHCHGCQERAQILFRSFAEVDAKEVICPYCGETNLKRLISKVRVIHTGSSHPVGQAASVSPAGDDPRALVRSMREAGREAGQDMGKEFNEVAGRLERGEQPEAIEKALRKRVGEDKQVH